MSAWQKMDDWCARESAAILEDAVRMLRESGFDTSDPAYRVALGQSQAFHRMRSFIHGARDRDGTRSAETACPAPVPQDCQARAEGIAHSSPKEPL